MIKSLSEFRFFKSFRIPLNSSDDVRYSVTREDLYSDRGEFLDDVQILDVSTTGLGLKTKAKLKIDDSVAISLSYKRLRFDISCKVVRVFSGHFNDPTMNYGVEVSDEEDLFNMKRFIDQLISNSNQERVRDSLRKIALAEFNEDLTEGFEMLSLMLSLYKDIMNFSQQEGFIDSILEESLRILNAQRGVVYLINTEENQLEAKHAIGVEKSKLRFDYRKGVAGSVYTTTSALNIDKSHEKIKFFEKLDKKLGVQTTSVICHPIFNKQDKPIGVIEIINKKNAERFTDEDGKVMRFLSLIFSSFFRQYDPVSEKSLIRRFSAPNPRALIWIGRSEQTTELRKCILKVKDLSEPLTIFGERGVGKKLYAKILHKEGNRGLRDYGVINFSKMEDHEIIEKISGEKGYFNQCIGGTITFSDFHNASKEIQNTLITHIEKNMTLPKEEMIRLIFTTQALPLDLRRDGKITNAFFDILNENIVNILPIRERKKDVRELLDYFLSKECQTQGYLQKVFSTEIKEKLAEYEWPGNVTELMTAVSRLVRFNTKNHVITEVDDKVISILQKPMDVRISSEIPFVNDSSLLLKERVLLVERELILAEIKQVKGNKSKAAKLMGISREALRKKLIACNKVHEKVQELAKERKSVGIDEDTAIIKVPKAA